MSGPWFVALKGVAWDKEKSQEFVAMFAEIGVHAIAGHNDDLVILTIYDQQAAEDFLAEMRATGIDAVIASSKDEFIKKLR